MIIPRVLLFPRLSLSISSNRGLKSSVILNTHAPIPWWGPEITNGREVVAHAGGNEVHFLD
jgi:hypothetical protein